MKTDSYIHRCRHCEKDVAYSSIWEAELYWGHACPELKAHQKRIAQATTINHFKRST